MEPLMSSLFFEGFLQTIIKMRIKGKATEKLIEPHNAKT